MARKCGPSGYDDQMPKLFDAGKITSKLIAETMRKREKRCYNELGSRGLLGALASFLQHGVLSITMQVA